LNVKVLKDWANRPFSFVQYATAQEATYALQKGQKAILDGRMIRVERARVNRTLYISKDKGKIDEAVLFSSPQSLISRQSNSSSNPSAKSRRLSFLDHGNVPRKNPAKAASQDSCFATMPSTHIRFFPLHSPDNRPFVSPRHIQSSGRRTSISRVIPLHPEPCQKFQSIILPYSSANSTERQMRTPSETVFPNTEPLSESKSSQILSFPIVVRPILQAQASPS